MAWIEKAPSGKFRGCYRNAAGDVRRKSFSGKTAARAWAEEQEELVRRGQWRDPKLGRITVAEWSTQWMAARVVEASTSVNDVIRMRRIVAEWGDTPVEHLTTIGLQGWVRRMMATGADPGKAGKGAAPATVQKYVHLLSSMLTAAVRERIITDNPAHYLQLPHVRTGLEVFLDRAEVESITAQLADPYAALVWTLALTGMRWGELAGLHVDQLDMLRRTLTVDRVVVQVAGERTLKPYPKSSRSRRSIPLPVEAVDILAAHLAAYPAQPCGLSHPDRETCAGIVFRHPSGGLLSRHPMPGILRRAAVKGGVERHFRVHDLRHTYASWLVQAGVPLYDVQHALGHESITTTQKYAHLAPGQHDRVRAAMDGLPGGKTGGKISEPHRS